MRSPMTFRLRHPSFLLLASLFTLLVVRNPARAAKAEPAGKQLYLQYCASCHGTDGRGDGPAAAALKTPPTDLTTIAQRNGGKFDERQLMASIDGERFVAAHGSREMPVWGQVFDEELKSSRHAERVRLLRAQVLVDYLRTLQR